MYASVHLFLGWRLSRIILRLMSTTCLGLGHTMKRDPSGAVSQITSFIGAELSDDVLTKIVHQTSFEIMKDDNTANYSWNPLAKKENAPKFMRKGIVGDWKNFLFAEQSAEMDAICAVRLKDTGLD